MKGIKVGNKESKYPIIQGGMGVGVSMHNLAGNVSKEGGIGVISSADIGYKEEDFKTNPREANIRAIGKEIKLAREIAGQDKIIAMNIMVAMRQYDEIVEEAEMGNLDLLLERAIGYYVGVVGDKEDLVTYEDFGFTREEFVRLSSR